MKIILEKVENLSTFSMGQKDIFIAYRDDGCRFLVLHFRYHLLKNAVSASRIMNAYRVYSMDYPLDRRRFENPLMLQHDDLYDRRLRYNFLGYMVYARRYMKFGSKQKMLRFFRDNNF